MSNLFGFAEGMLARKATEGSLVQEAIQSISTALDRLAEWGAVAFLLIRTVVARNLPLLAAAVTILGSLLVQRIRVRDERRAEHLAELKHEVLHPMLAYLDQVVLPILRREAGNVDICFRRTANRAAPMDRPIFEPFVCVRPVKEPLQAYLFGDDALGKMPGPPEGPLVDDARRHHFPGLLHRWEALMARFLDYNGGCLRYVEARRAQIAEENSHLPEFDHQTDSNEWLNPYALAVIVFYEQLAIPIPGLDFRREGDGRLWLYKGALTVAKGTPMQMVRLEAGVKKLMERRDLMQPLTEMARSLETDAKMLRVNIDTQRLKRRLSGKCSFL